MKNFFLYLILCLLCVSVYSQSEENEISHYVFPEFMPGVVLMKNGMQNKTLLNYNALSEEMVFEEKGRRLAIANTPYVDTVFIDGRKFIPLNDKFFELVYQANYEVFVEHKCRLIDPGKNAGYGGTSQTSSVTSYSSVDLGGKVYDLKLSDFKVEPYIYYLLKKNGELNRFLNMKQIEKLYSEKKDLFKSYVKKNNVKFYDRKSIIELINYMESK